MNAAAVMANWRPRPAGAAFFDVVLDNLHCVVDGNDAQHLAVLVHNGHGHQVVLGNVGGNFVFRLFGQRCDQLVEHDVGKRGVVLCQHQRAQRKHAHQLVVFVQHVHVVHGGVVFVQAAQHFGGFLHGVGGVHGHELGGHQAACSVFGDSPKACGFPQRCPRPSGAKGFRPFRRANRPQCRQRRLGPCRAASGMRAFRPSPR